MSEGSPMGSFMYFLAIFPESGDLVMTGIKTAK
jgi:hypothetical protein